MNDQIKLHESISLTLPGILERNPFRVAVTPHHILTETAGFAVPVMISDAPLALYASHVRTAGQMVHDDIVGWAILVRYLEATTGQDIEALIINNVLVPLGINSQHLRVTKPLSALRQLDHMTGSGTLIAEIARLMIRNQATDGTRFLPKDLHDLMVRNQSWRMHPLTPNRTYGGKLQWSGKQSWLSPAPSITDHTPTFMAFPDAGLAFIALKGSNKVFEDTVLGIAKQAFLPGGRDGRQAEANLLVPYERFSGYYVRADAPTAWLRDRLDHIQNDQIHLREREDGTLHVRLTGPDGDIRRQYHYRAPFHYQAPGGSTLTLSPYKSGGYLLLDGVLYRYMGILGNKLFVINLLPFVLITLLSSGFYASSKTSRAWRKMGQFGFIGTLMVCTGLICDYLWWPSALFEWNMPILINLWRATMNFGLMLVLSLPLFALSFVQRNHMPEGKALLYVPFHLALISIAAAFLFLILVAWGSAAEFSAY